ncbi:MAG: hypothetical protein JNM56_10305 [Planctomycetia bacterium]|nr:hypothetical protein [Planctomycetia bacterium]
MEDNNQRPRTLVLWDNVMKHLPPKTDIGRFTRTEAGHLLDKYNPRSPWRLEPASSRQIAFLQKHGLWRPGMTKGPASDVIQDALERDRQAPGYLDRLQRQAAATNAQPRDRSGPANQVPGDR